MTRKEDDPAPPLLGSDQMFEAVDLDQLFNGLTIQFRKMTKNGQQTAEILKATAQHFTTLNFGNVRERQLEVALRGAAQPGKESAQTGERTAQTHRRA